MVPTKQTKQRYVDHGSLDLETTVHGSNLFHVFNVLQFSDDAATQQKDDKNDQMW